MGTKKKTDHRAALLKAASRLATRGKPLTAAAVAKEARVDAKVFKSIFGTHKKFLVELHGHFLSELLSSVIGALSGPLTGVDRLKAGITAFLDACLEQRGLRQLLLEMERDPEIAAASLGRRRGFLQMLKLEFDALGWLHAAEAARLFRASIEEASSAEIDAGERLPKVRETLWFLLRD